MMRRFLWVVCTIWILAACDVSPAPRVYTIGIVNPVAMRDPVVDAFQDGLAELGYVEGETIRYLYTGEIPDAEARATWVQELITQDVDLILGIATPGAVSASQGTDDIPVLFFPVTDPVGSGLVESLRQPGGNVTGITNGNPHPLRLQLLLELDPSIETIYAPYDGNSLPARSTVPSVVDTAERLGVNLIMPQVYTDDDVRDAIQAIPDEADAIFAMPDPLVANHWEHWSQAAIMRQIPYSSLSYAEVQGGVLMSYGEELDAVGKQAARMAHTIFHGISPADIPVEEADFFLALNIDTAQKINLNVPDELLQRATYVIYP